MSKIESDLIQEIKNKNDIVEVISEYVILKKKGKESIGLCPFHSEKSPSFTVSQEKQMYYCFGCQAGGDVITFHREINNHRSFADAVIDLAARANISLSQNDDNEINQRIKDAIAQGRNRQLILSAIADAQKIFISNLELNDKVYDYLHGIRIPRYVEFVEKYEFGYALGNNQILTNLSKKYSLNILLKAGLIKVSKDGEYLDFFRDRMTIPIHVNGKIVGFGARTFNNQVQPKYLNSPENDIFNKSNILFNLHRAKAAIRKQRKAVIVEGYFDALILDWLGVQSVIACMGVAITKQQLTKLSNLDSLTLWLDGDSAGQNAIATFISNYQDLINNQLLNLRIIDFDKFKDPAEAGINLGEDIKDIVEHSHSLFWIDWEIKQILKGKNLEDVVDLDQAYKGLADILKKINNLPGYELYLEQIAFQLSLNDSDKFERLKEKLFKETRKHKKISISSIPKASNPQINPNNSFELLEINLLDAFINNRKIRPFIIQSIANRQTILQNIEIWEILKKSYLENPDFIPASFQSIELEPEILSRLNAIAFNQNRPSDLNFIFNSDDINDSIIAWQIELILIQVDIFNINQEIQQNTQKFRSIAIDDIPELEKQHSQLNAEKINLQEQYHQANLVLRSIYAENSQK